jgi:hypothetical protein
MNETSAQVEVRDRVVKQYLPAWCASAARPEPLDPSAFVSPDWSFLTPGLADWFLRAIDERVVEVSDGGFRRGHHWSEGIFEHGPKADPRPMKLRKESFIEIAAVGILATRYCWPLERLRFQSATWAFDFLAYGDEAWSEVTIAGEAKLDQKDAVRLSASLAACGRRGDHSEADCSEPRNHHRKYIGLLKERPRIVWIAGPEAFAGDPDLVFRVEERSGGTVHLRPIDGGELKFPSLGDA